jgi:short subunit dehydrogenase-like uncharacterized protein
MNDKADIDVCLFGATGFAGRLTAKHLARRCAEAGLVFALAGRSVERLEALRAELSPQIRIRTADSSDPASLDRLAGECRVICSTVGPYARYGTPLIAACAAHGTDYLDLTGEVPWIRDIIDGYEETARQSGSRIVPSCGFDSIPSDLGVLTAQQALRDSGRQTARALELRVEAMQGGFSRGTLESMRTLIKAAVRSRRVRTILSDEDSLTPEWGAPQPGNGPPRRDNRGAWRDSTGAWCMPFFMDRVNGRIVRRSHALQGRPYGPDFSYREVLPLGRGPAGLLAALAARLGMGVVTALLVFPPTRLLAAWLLFPKRGQGPRMALEGGGMFRLGVYDPEEGSKLLSISADRDPGYGATAIMLGEAAVLLAETTGDASSPAGGGVLTPAAAFGSALVTRLHAAGIRFERFPNGSRPADDSSPRGSNEE